MEIPKNLYAKVGPRPPSLNNSKASNLPYAQVYLQQLIPNPATCSAVYSEKVKDQTLLLDNLPESFQTNNSTGSPCPKKNKNKNKNKHLSHFPSNSKKPLLPSTSKKVQQNKRWTSKQKKEAGLYLLPKKSRNFDLFLPLHHLWLQYIRDLRGTLSPTAFLEKLVKADFHGALLVVTRSKCPNYVKFSGIMIRETTTSFHCITSNDQVVHLPKKNTVFSFHVDGFVYTIYGNQFLYRSAERSARKLKPKPTIDF